MQKHYKFIFSFFAAFMLLCTLGFSQPDTVLVPVMVDGTPFGSLNKFIGGDTLANGDRVNPERTYKLEQNKIYFLNGVLAANYDLRIIADEPTDTNKPPIITTGIDMAGAAAAPDLYIQCFGDATFKNIIVQLTPPNLQVEIAFSIQLLKENGKYLFDRVLFQGSRWLSIGSWAVSPSVTIKNCHFRNTESTTDVFNGRGISFQDRPVDTIIMTNNTFFNVNSFALQGQNSLFNYCQFEHNTIVNSAKWPIQWQWMTNARFANNIFYNAHSYGEGPGESQDVDGLPFGVINITNLPQNLLDSVELNLTEAGRAVEFANNVYFYSPEIMSYFADSSFAGGDFMNSRTMGYFSNSADYPLMTSTNTMNMDPGFINDGDVESDLVTWMTELRGGNEVMYWGYDPDDDRFGVQWPLAEDLSYTNENLKTAGDGQYPIGDLNWWNLEEAWELDPTDNPAVSINYVEAPKNFTLEQNIPNPFSGETIINYTVTEAANINISIFDIQGRLVKVLADERHLTGDYTVTWGGVNADGNRASSGIYFYTLRSGNSFATGKMTLTGN